MMRKISDPVRSNPSPCPVAALYLLLFAAPDFVFGAVSSDAIRQLIDQGQLQDALRQVEQTLSEDQEDVTALFLQGVILTKSGALDQARQVFERLTEQRPDLPEPYNNLAVVYAALGEFDRAEDALRKAINTHPSYATAHENIGDIYGRMASRAYHRALQLDGESIDGEGSGAKTTLSLIDGLFSLPGTTSLRGAQTPQAVAGPTGEAQAAGAPLDTNGRIAKHITRRLGQWASAWSAQDVSAYLSFYAEAFTPPDEQSRALWEMVRAKRISAPQFIRLDIADVEVTVQGPGQAQAIFSQKYQSDTYDDEVVKIMLLRKINNTWYIVAERNQ